MIKIFMLIGYGNVEDAKEYNGEDLIHIFKFEDKCFMYVETQKEELNLNLLPHKGLKMFPNGNYWEYMPNVYLTSVPKSVEHWNRNRGNTQQLRINRLKYEKVSSYIFNHYRLQEEKWDKGREKYDSIFIYGTTLVYYTEPPRIFDDEPYDNLLNTQDTPHEEWHNLMGEHFNPFENYNDLWVVCEQII